MTFSSLIPDVSSLLALEPEELAGVLLQYLSSADSSELNRHNFLLSGAVSSYPKANQDEVKRALTEAWVWLEREGLLAPRPGDSANWVFITRRGTRVASPELLAAYRLASSLPREQLHPVIGQKVWATFLRGDYDTAVFQSFKELEVRTRRVAGLGDTDIGVELMRKAFRPSHGPLSNPASPLGEQEALMHLMAGAIGSYKNPHSHRDVAIESEEAVEMIVLASHLLKIVDRQAERRAGTRIA